VGSLKIVEVEVARQALLAFPGIRVIMQIHLLVLDRTPKSLGEGVVRHTAAAIHAHQGFCCQDPLPKFQAGELATLVGVVILWPAAGRSQWLAGEIYLQALAQLPFDNKQREPIQQRHQVQPAMAPAQPGSGVNGLNAHLPCI